MLIIVNPKYKRYKEEIVSFKEHDPEVYVMKKKHNHDRIKAMLVEKDHDVIVAIGGDGTAFLASQFVVGTGRKLAIVPRGSTNGLFNNITDKERPLEKRKEKDIDVMDIDGKYCLHAAGFGLNAYIIKKSRKDSFVGFVRYVLAFFSSIFDFRNHYFKVDGDRLDTIWLLLANGSNKGIWKLLNPNGRFDDGYFEVCTIDDQRKFTEARIENPQGSPFHIDGEYMGHPKEINVKVMPKALTLLI